MVSGPADLRQRLRTCCRVTCRPASVGGAAQDGECEAHEVCDGVCASRNCRGGAAKFDEACEADEVCEADEACEADDECDACDAVGGGSGGGSNRGRGEGANADCNRGRGEGNNADCDCASGNAVCDSSGRSSECVNVGDNPCRSNSGVSTSTDSGASRLNITRMRGRVLYTGADLNCA
jgi:hypothetical protein